MDPEMGIGRMPRRGRAGMPGGMAMAEQEPSPYYLFRFFDFNVEPGTYYRYRVRLLLANPNKDLPRRFVKPPELVEKRWVETDWSEPTNPIFVPRDDRVLAVSVKPPRRPWDEPSGKILAVHWDMDLGLEVSEEFDVQRGLLANFPDRDASFLQNRRPISIGGLEGGPGIGGMLGGTEDPEEQPKVDYRTEALVLDMAGGERLSRRDRDQTSPGKILLLAANGNLVVHDELEDARAVASREKPEEVETIPGRGRPEGREMGPGGEFGEFEGMPPFGGEAAGRGRGRRNPRTRQPPRVPGREM